jgi:hypothetical protein
MMNQMIAAYDSTDSNLLGLQATLSRAVQDKDEAARLAHR